MQLDRFISDINKRGIVKASNFQVLLSRPGNVGNTQAKDLTMRIDSTDVPGRSLTTTESNYSGMTYKIVSGTTFGEIPMTIILSEKMVEKTFIEEWQDLAIGKFRTEEIQGNSFNLGYYMDYVGTVEITQYNELGKPIYRTKLIDAYPSAVGNMSISWENNSEVLRLPVSFTYRYYKKEDTSN